MGNIMEEYNTELISILERRLKNNPKDIDVAKLLAISYFDDKQYGKALELSLEILSSTLNDYEETINTIRNCFSQLALDVLSKLIEKKDKNDEVYIQVTILNIIDTHIESLRDAAKKGVVNFILYRSTKLPLLLKQLDLFLLEGISVLAEYKNIPFIDDKFKTIYNFEDCFNFLKNNKLSNSLLEDDLLVDSQVAREIFVSLDDSQSSRELLNSFKESRKRINKKKELLEKEQKKLEEMKRNLDLHIK